MAAKKKLAKKTKKKLAKKTVKRALAKAKYKCGSCGKRGHNARTCGR